MTQPDSLQETVVVAIARACNVSPQVVTPELSIQQLGLDSMNMTSVLSELEATYDIELTSDQIIDMLQLEKVGDLIAYVSRIAETEYA